MFVNITLWTLRIAAILALLLGLGMWTGLIGGGIVMLHMLLGIIVMLAVLILGGMAAFTKGGNMPMGITAIVVGILLIVVGLGQLSFLRLPPSFHWIIQVLHLLIAIASVGIGDSIVRSLKRAQVSTAMSK